MEFSFSFPFTLIIVQRHVINEIGIDQRLFEQTSSLSVHNQSCPPTYRSEIMFFSFFFSPLFFQSIERWSFPVHRPAEVTTDQKPLAVTSVQFVRVQFPAPRRKG